MDKAITFHGIPIECDNSLADSLTGGIDRAPNPFWRTPLMTVATISDTAAQLADQQAMSDPEVSGALNTYEKAWDQIVRMHLRSVADERDEALTMRNETMTALNAMREERDEGTARNLILRAAFDRSEAQLADYAARNKGLQEHLHEGGGWQHNINLEVVPMTRFVELEGELKHAKAELTTLRTRLAERDASLVKALRQRV